SGIRSWPDALLGAARLWLHPGDWPETSDGQTRQVLTVTLFAVTAAAALLVRAAGQPVLTGSLRHPATTLWLAPILLRAPLPPPPPPPPPPGRRATPRPAPRGRPPPPRPRHRGRRHDRDGTRRRPPPPRRARPHRPARRLLGRAVIHCAAAVHPHRPVRPDGA